MSLIEKQHYFAVFIARLIQALQRENYLVTFGEAYRPHEMAELYAKQGKGTIDSLHGMRLAIDLNLFKDGRYLTETNDYRRAGIIWEGYSTQDFTCMWGGHFDDGNHFSFEHGGRA